MHLDNIDNAVRKVRLAEKAKILSELAAVEELLNPKTIKTIMETELPSHTGTRKGLIKSNGGDLNNLWDSPRFDSNRRSRRSGHNSHKDYKTFKPWQKTGSVVKSILEPEVD